MKQVTALTLLVLLTIATPAFAAPSEKSNGNGKANGHNKDNAVQVQEVEVSPEPSAGPSGAPAVTVTVEPSQAVTPSVAWKNHGQYVSSVAKTHPGGQAVSAAARSDIGKKQKENPTPSVIPSATPSAVPSVVPSGEPSVVPSGEPTPSVPSITSAQEAAAFKNPIDAVIAFFQGAVDFFTGLKVI